MNAFDFLDSYIKNNGIDNQDNVPKNGFVQINHAFLGEYLNLLARQQTVTRQDIRSNKLALETTGNLINLIKREYQIH